jgi:C-terminal processing protease CtpA/Prc
MHYPEPGVRQKMLDNLDVIKTQFEAGYAPRAWKLKHNGWYLNGAIEEAKDRVEALSEPSLKAYHQIVRDFFNSTKDYHVGVRFLSTELAFLPISVVPVEGRYFIVDIDREKLSATAFPFSEGDEIVTFDGQPVKEVVDSLVDAQTGKAHLKTDEALASLFLTFRFGAAGMDVPKGALHLGIRPNGSDSIRNIQLMWEYYPEKVSLPSSDNTWGDVVMGAQWGDSKVPLGLPAQDQSRINLPFPQLFDKKVELPLFESMHAALQLNNSKRADNAFSLGARDSMIPPLGDVWWQADPYSAFDAYIYTAADGRRVGFVRVPHYSSWGWEAFVFGDIIAQMEEATDALVIDQLNNPGGSVFYCYALASMLTDQPLATPRHRMAITPEEVMWAKLDLEFLEQIKTEDEAKWVLGQHLGGYPVTFQMVQFFKEYCRFLMEEWEAGRHVTNPSYLMGVDYINPHPQYRYTKPILLLTNELDFSGGDFFPAILQDNERVRVMGTRTAGAGGYVLGGGFFNSLGIMGFSYTGSLAERKDGQPIEDLGVTPDVDYSLTAADIQDNFVDFVAAINAEVLDLMGPAPEVVEDLAWDEPLEDDDFDFPDLHFDDLDLDDPVEA